MHAVEKTPVHLNDSVLVVGAGMIGLLCLQSIKAAGCGKTFVVDLDESRLEVAKQFGADFCLNPSKVDVIETILAETHGRGADLSMEAVGITASTKTAISCLRKGGSCTLVGNIAQSVEMPLQEVVTRQITLIGSCASAGEYPACLDLIASGKINVGPLISQVRPLEEGGDWFARLHKGEAGLTKVILNP